MTSIPVRTKESSREPSPTVVLKGNTGSGSRTIFARAAKLTQDSHTGRSTLSSELLAIAARQAKHQETVDIILVTADAHHSLLMPLPEGLVLAGVVAEWETDPRFSLPLDLTVVAGVGGAREAVPEGEWLIIDPVRLRVMIAPDAGAVGRLQQRSRPRYRIGHTQVVARTLSGTEVPVWARVFTRDDLQEAAENGADGFVVDGPGDFLPWDIPDNEPDGAAFARLLPVADAAGGGDVVLLTSLETIDAPSLVRLAAHCRLRLLLSPESLTVSLPELRAELAEVADAELDAGRLAETPRFAALLSTPPRASFDQDPEEWYGFDETAFLPFDDTEVMNLNYSDVLTVPPMFAFLSSQTEEQLAEAIDCAVFAGLRGVIVSPGQVRRAKEVIPILN